MTNIQNAREKSYMDSLDLGQDLDEILENNATEADIKYIRDIVSGII